MGSSVIVQSVRVRPLLRSTCTDLFAEPRCSLSEVAVFKVIGTLVLAAQHASANWTVRNHSNSQFAARLEQFDLVRFDVESKGTVFYLDGVDVLDFARAAQGLAAAFRETDVLDEPFVLELLELLDGLFDGSLAVEAVGVVCQRLTRLEEERVNGGTYKGQGYSVSNGTLVEHGCPWSSLTGL